MDRITKRVADGIFLNKYNLNVCNADDFYNLQSILDKLANYEDTGLEPEDIKNNTKVTFDVGSDGYLQAIEIAFKDRFGMTTKEVVEVLDKCKEYKDLEEQGRLHIAPIKDGTQIFAPFIDPLEGLEEEVIESTYVYGLTEWEWGVMGKQWFLTRKEAEKALEGENEMQRL